MTPKQKYSSLISDCEAEGKLEPNASDEAIVRFIVDVSYMLGAALIPLAMESLNVAIAFCNGTVDFQALKLQRVRCWNFVDEFKQNDPKAVAIMSIAASAMYVADSDLSELLHGVGYASESLGEHYEDLCQIFQASCAKLSVPADRTGTGA